ncbi:MAG TPA: alpha/beta fold hydrolase [Anaerolineales bacterium]|nr:alpha/beta fold hydrolase [Anaerolineales bacterium]
MKTKTIVLVHGLSASKHSWDQWVSRYQSRGYKVIAPAYHPGLDKSMAELKQNPNDPLLSTITLPQVLDYLTKVIKGLDEKPIIMGHSFGGLLTQLLLQRDLGAAGVAVDGAPPPGIPPTQLSFLRFALPIFNPLIPSSKPWYMTFEQFQFAWAHTLPLAEQRAAYEAVIVPESRGLYRSGLSSDAKVDWTRPRAPLLIIAGEKDHIFHPAVNEANQKRYAKSPSVTDFKVFPGRTHYTVVAGKGWEDVADYALDWSLRQNVLAEGVKATRPVAATA